MSIFDRMAEAGNRLLDNYKAAIAREQRQAQNDPLSTGQYIGGGRFRTPGGGTLRMQQRAANIPQGAVVPTANRGLFAVGDFRPSRIPFPRRRRLILEGGDQQFSFPWFFVRDRLGTQWVTDPDFVDWLPSTIAAGETPTASRYSTIDETKESFDTEVWPPFRNPGSEPADYFNHNFLSWYESDNTPGLFVDASGLGRPGFQASLLQVTDYERWLQAGDPLILDQALYAENNFINFAYNIIMPVVNQVIADEINWPMGFALYRFRYTQQRILLQENTDITIEYDFGMLHKATTEGRFTYRLYPRTFIPSLTQASMTAYVEGRREETESTQNLVLTVTGPYIENGFELSLSRDEKIVVEFRGFSLNSGSEFYTAIGGNAGDTDVAIDVYVFDITDPDGFTVDMENIPPPL